MKSGPVFFLAAFLAAGPLCAASDPDDLSHHNDLAQALLYREMFLRRAGLKPSHEVEQRFFSRNGRSMQLSQTRIAKHSRDTTGFEQLRVAFAPRAGHGRMPLKKIYYETGNAVAGTRSQYGSARLMLEGQVRDLQNRHKPAMRACREAVRFAPEAEGAHRSPRYINSPYTRPNHNPDRG